MTDLVSAKTYGNLWMTHPPFQIDGNFGYAAGVNEMLLQSHVGEIHLLPAIPAAWSSGSVHGMLARGDYIVDMDWQDGALTHATIRAGANSSGKCTVRLGKKTLTFELKPGMTNTLTPGSFE